MDETVHQLLELTDHRARPQPLTPDQAHAAMRTHRHCTTEDCRRKRQAFQTLVGLGHIVPDSFRGY
ncbi:hypothetical protein [Nocardia sp. CNY236]|uniref:hypothetical protein n=1 Tax=Nocardia sp. CNY236 TaxID=1169152 RepID=UPI00042822AF|nr:hypothetical protein [Nocardia sp. CNY236]